MFGNVYLIHFLKLSGYCMFETQGYTKESNTLQADTSSIKYYNPPGHGVSAELSV
ncbi:hypothetical protein Csa_004941 [Cucumis sativus]|uniref:Uncharacterized protein n=1 Tax=Cucumis sativus TaxID=3659 RepID=A0A0A0K517_CUCSA|nr:hypothetical protein Csa_004941 [Cucumis sativus]